MHECKEKMTNLYFLIQLVMLGYSSTYALDAIYDFQFQGAIRKHQLKTQELFIHFPLVESNFNILCNSKYSLVYLPRKYLTK